MKVAVFGLENFPLGKKGLLDKRLKQLQEIFNSKKTTPIQIDFVAMQELKDAEVLFSKEGNKVDLILSDLEYVQERITKDIPSEEKELFVKAKELLEKEEFLSSSLNQEELKVLRGFPLSTVLPIYLVKEEGDIDDADVLKGIYYSSGRICFFTAGEKDARAWSLRKGQTALEAAGCIHSDIQQGFIRAEVVSTEDLFSAGHYNQVKNEGKVRLENKDYVVQDGDYILFRFNK